jgi:3-phosphoshikimate 1-carboxyvinyltransferase
MAKELKKLLLRVDERDDSLHLFPHENLNKFLDGGLVSIETYEDHRFAMSFAVLGCHNLYGNFRPWIRIVDPLCCEKTFPTFFDKLQEYRMNKG